MTTEIANLVVSSIVGGFSVIMGIFSMITWYHSYRENKKQSGEHQELLKRIESIDKSAKEISENTSPQNLDKFRGKMITELVEHGTRLRDAIKVGVLQSSNNNQFHNDNHTKISVENLNIKLGKEAVAKLEKMGKIGKNIITTLEEESEIDDREVI